MSVTRRASGSVSRLARAVCIVTAALLVTVGLAAERGHAQAPAPGASAGAGDGQGSLGDVAAKLSNPVSDVWALFTEFDLTFSDGDVNLGDAKVGGRMIFQPILPIPLYGSGSHEWKLITRPTIPVIFSEAIPTGLDEFQHRGGLGDTQLPLMVSPPSGDWLLGLGTTWLFPTSTNDAFGRQQWGVGPAGVLGWKHKWLLAGVFPQYTFGIGSRGDRDSDTKDASYLSMLYFFVVNLPDAWQVGMNPTISYDHRAPAHNKWNLPVGLFASKTVKIGRMPVKIQAGIEYSVVSQDLYGQVAQFKLNIIPVIPALLKRPLLGGR